MEEKKVRNNIDLSCTEAIEICFITDKNYLIPTMTAISSLIATTKQNINVNVITDGISEKYIKPFYAIKSSNVSIKFLSIENSFNSINAKHEHVSKSALLKFDLANIFKDLNKILYIDSDVLIMDDLKKLWATDLEGTYAAVVADNKRMFSNKDHERLGLEKYFNSGVMLLNLKKIRDEHVSEKLLANKLSDKYKKFMDQDSFNVTFAGNVKWLQFDYNFIPRSFDSRSSVDICNIFGQMDDEKIANMRSCPKILHLAGSIKPWEEIEAPLFDVWYKYFTQLPFCRLKSKYQKRLFLSNFKYFLRRVFGKKKPKIDELIISLTSYPARINTVVETIKTLINQSIKADRILLWLNELQFENKESSLPAELLKLQEGNSFEICWYSQEEDYKPYNKLINTLKKYPNAHIITADDDILYHKDCVKSLCETYAKYPKCIIANRVHKIVLNGKRVDSYKKWIKAVNYKKPSYSLLLTGVGTVLYPPKSLYKDVLKNEIFMKICRNTDDIWFWAMALLNNRKIKLADENYSDLLYVSDTQSHGLYINNCFEGNNDTNIESMLNYYPVLLRKIKPVKKIKLSDIFSIKNKESKNNQWHKVIKVLGFKISFKSNVLTQKKHMEMQNARLEAIRKEIKSQGVEIKKQINNLNEEIGQLKIKIENFNNEIIESKTETLNMCKEILDMQRANVSGAELSSIKIEQIEKGILECVSISKYAYNEKLIKDKVFPIVNTLVYVPDYPTDYIQRSIVQSGNFYEIDDLKFLDQFLSHDSVILDIGANIGNHSLYWAKRTEAKRIYSFEPIKITFEKLKKNIEINGLQDRIIPYNIGVSNAKGLGEIRTLDIANFGGSTIQLATSGDIEVNSIDNLNIPDSIDLIKIDTEGFEYQVLCGARETITKNRPVVYLEINDSLDEIEKYFDELGYQKGEKVFKKNYIYRP